MAEVRRGQGQRAEAERARLNTTAAAKDRRAKIGQVLRLQNRATMAPLIQANQASALQSSANQTQTLVTLLSGLTGVDAGKATAGNATHDATKLEQRLAAIRAGRLGDTQLANRVAKVISNTTGMALPGAHHDDELWEKDLNFVSGNEPRKRMMRVFRSLYNVFGPEGNDRLTELIFRNKEYFGSGIQSRSEDDHYDHLHYGFGS